LLLIAVVIVAMIPLIGAIALWVLWPVLVGGLMLGCRALDNGETLELQHLWAGFESGDRLTQLIIVGAAYLIAMAVIIGLAFAAIGLPALQSIRGDGAMSFAGIISLIGSMMIGVLLAMALMVPLMMAVWFAPPLILFNHLNAVDAMKLSFGACLRNIVPFLIYGVIVFALNFVAAIPFGLGYLVWIPVLMGSLYMGYKDIFAVAEPAAKAAGNPLLR